MSDTKTILVIDDEEDVREVLKIALETQRGYQVLEAPNGEKGLEVMQAEKPDLVICDLKVPKLNGYQFVVRTSKDENLQKTPIIILTSLTSGSKKDDTDWRRSLGVSAFISKPFQPMNVINKVDELLGV
jgi:CheY-like chemotaxis protein